MLYTEGIVTRCLQLKMLGMPRKYSRVSFIIEKSLLNYRFFQKLKLFGYGKFNHLTTNF